MAKKKVHEIAKKYGLSSKALMMMLKKMGVSDVKSHMTILEDDVVEKIEKKFEQEKRKSKEEIIKKDVVAKKSREEKVHKVVKPEEKKSKTSTTSTASKKTTKTTTKPFEKKKGKKGKKKRVEVDQKEVENNIKKTMNKQIVKPGSRRKYKKEVKEEDTGEIENILRITEGASVAEIAKLMGVGATDVIGKIMELGMMVTINQRLPLETIEMVADDFEYRVELLEEEIEVEEEEEVEAEENLLPRTPVITIMGHVDHGKTTLLDYLRKSSVVKGEAGGITQHIGAYQIDTESGKMTFLDTPGHEAFTAMRSRGADITDIIILIVAADSGVMPQTKEAISHSKAANVPIIIAINKCDLPTSNVDKVKAELSEAGLIIEEWGGDYQCVEISALKGDGVDDLLELIGLQAEMLELKANPNRSAVGHVIEAEMKKGLGAVGTVLITQGTLKKGDTFYTGHVSGKVRLLLDDKGKQLKEAGPSTPIQVVGYSDVPHAGDKFVVTVNEKEAREIAEKRQVILKEKQRQISNKGTASNLEDLFSQIKSGEVQYLNIIIKGDVDGSLEAIADSLEKLSNDEVKINIVHKAVGEIKESDVLLASASAAIIIGFHVRPSAKARELAEREGVDIEIYNIIYEIMDDLKKALSGLLTPDLKEKENGEAEVREIFKISKIGTIAGCIVRKGTVVREQQMRLFRDGVLVYEGELSSLKRFQDDVKEVKEGFECGLTIDKFNDIKVGDKLVFYKIVEVARELD